MAGLKRYEDLQKEFDEFCEQHTWPENTKKSEKIADFKYYFLDLYRLTYHIGPEKFQCSVVKEYDELPTTYEFWDFQGLGKLILSKDTPFCLDKPGPNWDCSVNEAIEVYFNAKEP